MIIQIDSREHKSELQRIQSQLDSMNIKYYISKLYVGDYMSLDNAKLCIDRKKDLYELCGNITQGHERFTRELKRAIEAEIKLIILCEHGDNIKQIGDVYFWHNKRRDELRWTTIDGFPRKVPKYPKAPEGPQIYKSLCTIRDKYNVDFVFCDKKDTGYIIAQLLEGKEWHQDG